jgi:adenylate cyclase
MAPRCPEPRDDHAAVALTFARAVLVEAAAWRRSNDLDLQLRVGLASGPAVGGVIGRQRLLFDLWGATVNTAARMKSSGVRGRIQLATSTWSLLGSAVDAVPREVDVKGLGEMTTYLVVEPS